MNNDFNTLGDILNENFADERFRYTCKVSMFFSFWGNIVGRKFKNKTKPFKITQNKLFVTCENSFVLQELNMFKSEILKNIHPYAKGLDLNIKDIVLSYKDWIGQNKNREEEIYNQDDFTKEELDCVTLGEEELINIKNNINKIPYLNDSQKAKYFENIKNSMKANILRRKL